VEDEKGFKKKVIRKKELKMIDKKILAKFVAMQNL
jgi:hypothetical protein